MKTTFLSILVLITSQSFSQVNLNLGLKAYYPFSGNAKDESGFNNNPVFNNATLTADRFGNPKSAYHFNGKNNYMKVANSASLNMANKLSISLWVKPTGFYTGKCYNNILLMKGDADYLAGNYSLRFSDVYTGCDYPTTKNERFFDGFTSIATYPLVKLNQWYHVVLTFDGKNSSLYVNCVLQAKTAFNAGFTNQYDLFIGHLNSNQFPYWLNGDLDEIRIYNRALNSEEIQALCEKTTTPQSPTSQKPDYVKAKVKEQKSKEIIKQSPSAKQTLAQSGTLPGLLNNDSVSANQVTKQFGQFEEVKLEERRNDLIKEIIVEQDSIAVTLYDNGIVDGDSVTLIYNNVILTTHQLLTEKPVTFYIKILPGNSRNELVMYAENLGSIPPNTALMVIYDGDKRYELNVSSSKSSNGVVSFKLKQ
ncbi:MAG: LamG domain-containing protein [Ferruginibacter sp.]